MPFEGPQIAVRITYTIQLREDMSLEKQIELTDHTLNRQLAGNDNLLIKVEKADVVLSKSR